MKRLVYFAVAVFAALFMASACNEKDEVQHRIVGEWKYVDEESGNDLDIRVAFNLDSTFDLYQKVGEGPHYLYKGKYNFDGQVLTGTYSDYTPWAHDYNVTKSNGSLTLTSVAAPDYSITFKKEAIPQSVRTHYMPVTKSEGVAPAVL